MIEPTIIKVVPSTSSRLYSTPRRFDLATIMVVTTAYALLFGALRFAPSTKILFVAGFITCVGIAQALLFGGKKPRMSSALVGVVWQFGLHMATGTIRLVNDYSSAIAIAIVGAFFGYLAGVVVGSVFLTSDMLRKSIQRCKSR